MMLWSQLGLQQSNSPVMEEFILFHDYVMLILILIISFVGFIMMASTWNKFININLLEGQTVECIWTIIPAIILVEIAIPSLLLLYMLEEGVSQSFFLKITGNQWYWSYEFPKNSTHEQASFEAYMIPSLSNNTFRLLDCDNRIFLPTHFPIQALVGSSDVLHSWTIPAVGVKADACPGRLNHINFISTQTGVFFGQCSEICGANHSFMPIASEFIKLSDFLKLI